MKGIGIAGAHRSGKTTTAREVSVNIGIEYLDANVSGVFAELGLDPKADLSIDDRLRVQDAILESLRIKYALQTKPFITDRTPIDVLAYSTVHLANGNLNETQSDMLTAHWTKAINITASHMYGCVLLRPIYGAPDAATSAKACPYYMQHVYAVAREVMLSMESVQGMPTLFSECIYQDQAERTQDISSLAASALLHNGIALEPKVTIWTPNS